MDIELPVDVIEVSLHLRWEWFTRGVRGGSTISNGCPTPVLIAGVDSDRYIFVYVKFVVPVLEYVYKE